MAKTYHRVTLMMDVAPIYAAETTFAKGSIIAKVKTGVTAKILAWEVMSVAEIIVLETRVKQHGISARPKTSAKFRIGALEARKVTLATGKMSAICQMFVVTTSAESKTSAQPQTPVSLSMAVYEQTHVHQEVMAARLVTYVE